MAVRTAYDPTAGEVLTAANVEKLAGGWIGYAEVTANQGSITTLVDLTSLSVAVTVGPSRRIRITGSGLMFSTVVDDGVRMTVNEGATVLQISDDYIRVTSNAVTVNPSVVLTPSTGAHTYKLMGQRATGTGTVTLSAGATFPAFICVEDLGPA